MDRRRFLQGGLVAAGGGAVATALPVVALAQGNGTAAPGVGPYGALADEPDENGLLLPEGFTSRVVAVAGEPVAGTGYAWLAFPDGAATFATDDGGWIHVVNSEVFERVAPAAGGVSAIRYSADGEIVDAYRILEGSNSNCAGGATPWGTWLSCEENGEEKGRVFECDPAGVEPAVARPAMGLWAHEAVAVDPESETLYLTQDHPTGLLYRFTPAAYPDLSAGLLEACIVSDDGSVSWAEVPDPSGVSVPTRTQVEGATVFPGAEGIWYHDGWIWFTTKIDHSVHGIDLREQRHLLLWRGRPDELGTEDAVLSGVDNITVDPGTGDLFVAEDGGNMEIVMITPEGVVAPFLRVAGEGHKSSEVTGPCFDPSRTRLYFSSQRGPTPKTVAEIVPGADSDASGAGITYEVTGPFRNVDGAPVASPTDTLARAGEAGPPPVTDGSDTGSVLPLALGAAGVLGVAAVGGAIALRRRRL